MESRKLSRRAFLKGFGLATGALALSGTFGVRVLSQPPRTTVGALFPFTGAGGEWGEVLQNTANLVEDQINEAARQTLGGPILDLSIEDDGTAPSQGVDRARKLVEVDQVPVLIGTWSSGVTIAVAESVTMPAEVLHVVPIATSPLIAVLPADKNDLLFRTNGSDALQGVVAAQLAAGELVENYRFKSAATVFVNNAYGQGLSNAFARSFQLRGGVVTAQVPIPEEPQPTYTSQLALALKDEPEVLLPLVYPGHGTVLLPESRDVFDYTRWQFADAMKSLEVLEQVGAADVAGKLGTVQGSDPERPGFRRFAQDYQARFGEAPPLPFMDTTYDAVAVVGLAIAETIAKGREITPAHLRDALRSVAGPPGETADAGAFGEALERIASGAEIDFSGAAGAVDFDEQGEVNTAIEVWRFTSEGFETVAIRKPEEIPPE